MKNQILFNSCGNLVWITYPRLSNLNFIKHGFSTRIGGISKKPFDTLNLSLNTSDEINNVLSNRKSFCSAISIDQNQLVLANQVHSANVKIVDSSLRGRGAYNYNDSVPETDAFITDEPNIYLTIGVADCVSIFIVDTTKKIVAVVHSGWRGTLSRISQHTLELMKKNYKTNFEDCIAVINPSIRVCCYEVGEDVIDDFNKEFQSLTSEVVVSNKNGKFNLNLQRLNEIQLIQMGIKKENIISTSLCTKCRQDMFFSYRGGKGITGGMWAVIGLVGG